MMNIKKIIQEEVNDFDWTSEVPMAEEIRDGKHLHDVMWSVVGREIRYKRWTVYPEGMSGTIRWVNHDFPYDGLATPMWHEDYEIPVDIEHIGNDRYENIYLIKVPKFTYVNEAKEWYSRNYYEEVSMILENYRA